MLAFLLALAAGAHAEPPTSAPSAPTSSPACEYNKDILELGFEKFDQEINGGWRPLSYAGCEEKAAQVIRIYRSRLQFAIPLLYWHEGQLRANMGDYKAAIALMEKSRSPDAEDYGGWNPYVDATISFLKNDRKGLVKAKARLEQQMKPDDWPKEVEWPQNHTAVEGLLRCFGKPYKIAYGSPECSRKAVGT